MKTCDFSRSFVTFVTRGRTNNARIRIEARCTVSDTQGHGAEDYFLVASCKGEDTYGAGVLFLEPSYDFCGIFSQREFMLIRVGVPYEMKNTVGVNHEYFEEVRLDLRMVTGEELQANQAIARATLDGELLNGRTEFADESGRWRALMEFPIKTMNVNDRRNLYQVDTGPVLLPDFASQKGSMVERFQLAFTAYNRADEAYFVIQEPIPVLADQADSPRVSHYSRIVRMAAKNSVVGLR
jgi:hypothetical protein